MALFDEKGSSQTPTREVERVLAEIELLADEPFPHGSEKLAGAEHTYRIRIGDYRVIYEVFAHSRVVGSSG